MNQKETCVLNAGKSGLSLMMTVSHSKRGRLTYCTTTKLAAGSGRKEGGTASQAIQAIVHVVFGLTIRVVFFAFFSTSHFRKLF